MERNTLSHIYTCKFMDKKTVNVIKAIQRAKEREEEQERERELVLWGYIILHAVN